MVLGAVLLAGCSQDDVALEVAPVEGIAIGFFCGEDETDGLTRAGVTGAMDSEDLHYTGFGVFASQTASTPDIMYNQEVKYTFVGDLPDHDGNEGTEYPLRGYWSYQPVKYWPANITNESPFSISAYAPYMEPGDLAAIDPTETGIIGISANTETPYIDYRRCEKPEDNVDLLWYYARLSSIPAAVKNGNTIIRPSGTLKMDMHHALARLKINVKVEALPGDTKVLIEKITLTGQMAETGRLSLNNQTSEGTGVDEKFFPIWSDQTYYDDGASHTITITNKENDADSYGIIAPEVRYIEDLPYNWQPAGLNTTTTKNALSTLDRPTYVYLIPQPTLSLTIKVKYHILLSAGGEEIIRTKTTTTTPYQVASPLRGNTTYSLELTLKSISTP